MAILRVQKTDLIEKDYWWDAVTTAVVFNGTPSRRLFDRFHGDQMLFLINYFGSISDQFSISEALKVEHALIHYLPVEIKSEISVINWLRTG